MKKISVAFYLLRLFAVCFVLLSCDNSTEPKEPQRLVIENGFYSKVASATPNEIKYKMEFVYYVKGEACEWGGYKIKMDSQEMAVTLYKMKTLKPDERHTVADTIKVLAEITNDPVVSMQGYKVGSSEAIETLKAVYILKPKI
jgi:ribonucleotide reductase beta subunit family protein with ferritin-like domain